MRADRKGKKVEVGMSGAFDEGIGWNGGNDAFCHAEYVSSLAEYREAITEPFQVRRWAQADAALGVLGQVTKGTCCI
jgi:hypothetical protein